MPKLQPPWEGPPIKLGSGNKRGRFSIDNETSAEEMAQMLDEYINGVFIKQLKWDGPCVYIVANEPITAKKVREWWIEDDHEDPVEVYGPIGFERDLKVR